MRDTESERPREEVTAERALELAQKLDKGSWYVLDTEEDRVIEPSETELAAYLRGYAQLRAENAQLREERDEAREEAVQNGFESDGRLNALMRFASDRLNLPLPDECSERELFRVIEARIAELEAGREAPT